MNIRQLQRLARSKVRRARPEVAITPAARRVLEAKAEAERRAAAQAAAEKPSKPKYKARRLTTISKRQPRVI